MPRRNLASARALIVAFSALAALTALAPPSARAGEGRWTPYGPLSGTFQELVPDPFGTGTLYALNQGDSPNSRILKSTDSGRSWSLSGTGLSGVVYLGGLAADPKTRGTLYAASFDALYRSLDAGAHWSRRSDESFQPYPPFQGGPLLLAATPSGRSVVLLCATADRVLHSADGGRTWTTALRSVQPLALHAGGSADAYLLTLEGEVRRSLDGGLTWESVWVTPAEASAGVVESFAIDPRHPSTLYLANRTELFRSTDRGGHWSQVTTLPREEGVRITALSFDPRAPKALYVAHSSLLHTALWVSRNGGATWSDRAAPLDRPALRIWSDPRRADLYAASENALALSHDFGLSWELPIEIGGLSGLIPSKLAFDPRAPRRRWLELGGILATSTDAGASWRTVPVRVAESDLFVLALAVDPTDSRVLYAGTNIGLLRSRDAGESWARLDAPVSSPGPLAAFLDPSGTTTLLAGDTHLVRSTDGGATWQEVLSTTAGLPGGWSRVLRSLQADPGDPATLFLATYAYAGLAQPQASQLELFRSRDGGATWTFLENLAPALAFDPAHPGWVYRLDSRGLAVSADQGDTWTVLGTGAGLSPIDALWIDPAALASPGSPASPTRFYAILGGTSVLSSDDEGVNWRRVGGGLQVVPSLRTLTGDPTVPHQVYLGTADGFFVARFP